VQETLLKAHQARGQFQGQDGPELAAWLRQILANTLIDAVRRFTSVRRDVAVEQSIEASIHDSSARLEAWLADDRSAPNERLERQEQLLKLAEALARLPDDEREALQLKHLEGWSVQAIAQRVGRSEAGVAGLLRRGLKRMRQLMGDGSS
jgi:RNA polymerase sigma-70 factor (ECF subfamily)